MAVGTGTPPEGPLDRRVFRIDGGSAAQPGRDRGPGRRGLAHAADGPSVPGGSPRAAGASSTGWPGRWSPSTRARWRRTRRRWPSATGCWREGGRTRRGSPGSKTRWRATRLPSTAARAALVARLNAAVLGGAAAPFPAARLALAVPDRRAAGARARRWRSRTGCARPLAAGRDARRPGRFGGDRRPPRRHGR